MHPDINLGVILASTRSGRRGEGFAHWFTDIAREDYTHATLRAWSEKIASLDAYVIVTPEYNHGYPGQLKNAIDHVHKGWFYKPVGFVSYGGMASGARAVEQLRLVAVEVRMVPVRSEVNIRLIGLQQENGRPTDPLYAKRAEAMLEELVWWGRVAREGRTQHPLPA